MKRNFYFAVVPAMMVAFAAFSLTGCEETNPDDPSDGTGDVVPVLAIEKKEFNVDAEGKAYTVKYTVENGVEGAEVSASATGSEWITGLDTETAGEIGFTVTSNEGSESRTGTVTVTYSYGDGESVTATFDVVQAAADEPDTPAVDPVLTLKPDTFETFPADPEDDADLSATVTVSVDNEVEGGVLSADSDADWLHPAVNGGNVDIALDRNLTTDARKATLTVTYTYGEEGKTVNATVTVSQAATELVPTEIILVGQDNIEVQAEGDDILIQARVDNGMQDGAFSFDADADWIVLDEENSSGNFRAATFFCTASANDSESVRNATITITYTYNTDVTLTKTISVTQAGKEPDTGGETGDYNFTAARLEGMNYGSFGDDGSFLYVANLISADGAETTFNYSIEFYSLESGAPVGHFVYSSNYTDGNIGDFSTISINGVQLDGIASGTADITRNDDGTYTYVIDLVDTDGNSHRVTYTGPVSF